MASVRKSTKGAQSAAEQTETTAAVNDTAEKEKAADGAQNAAEQAESAGTEKDTPAQEAPATGPQDSAGAGYKKFVYVGPSLPRGTLNHNAVFDGTMQEITEYLSGVLEDYPQVKRLIVPVHKLGEASAKAQTPGNILHKYYNDIVSAINSRKKEG